MLPAAGDPRSGRGRDEPRLRQGTGRSPRYRDDGPSFRSWLFAIAHNAIADDLRERRQDQPLVAADHLLSRAPTPEEVTLAAEERDTMRALLARLPADQAHLLSLRLAGLTAAEIAAALGMSPGAVRVAHHRAVARLRASLGDGSGKGASDA